MDLNNGKLQACALLLCVLVPTSTFAAPAVVENYQCGTTLQERLKLSYGIFVDEIQDHFVYESYGALVFQLRVPSAADWKLFTYFDKLCERANDITCEEGPDCGWRISACGMYHQFEQVTKRLSFLSHPSDEKFKAPSSGEGLRLDCDGVTEPFTRNKLTVEEQHHYLRKLESCASQRVLRVTSPDSQASDFGASRLKGMEQAYQDFRDLFRPSFDNIIHSSHADIEHSPVDGVSFGAMAALESIGFSETLAELGRWKEAAEACRSRRIPRSLISKETLQQSLEDFQMKTLDIHKNESMLLGEDNAALYDEHPLTDCVMVGDSLLVRIVVPVKKTNENWRIIGIKGVQYVKSPTEDPQVCYVKELGNNEKYFAIETDNSRVVPIKKLRGSRTLLRITGEAFVEHATHAFRRNCGYEIAKRLADVKVRDGALHELEACKVTCESGHNFLLPLVTRVGSDKFFVAGIPSAEDKVKYYNLRVFQQLHDGGVEVTLDCENNLPFKEETFLAKYPCRGGSGRREENIVIGLQQCNDRLI